MNVDYINSIIKNGVLIAKAKTKYSWDLFATDKGAIFSIPVNRNPRGASFYGDINHIRILIIRGNTYDFTEAGKAFIKDIKL